MAQGRRSAGRQVRRAFVPAAVFASLLVVPSPSGALGSGIETAVTPAGLQVSAAAPTPSDPLRVWVLGDSVMNDVSPALGAAFSATGEAGVVEDSSFGGWGLIRIPLWATYSNEIIDEFHPQVVVGTWSWDDAVAQDDPAGYLSLLRQALSVWLAPGDGVELVVLLQFPQIGPNPFQFEPQQRARLWATLTLEQNAWDRSARRVVADFPGHAVYLSTGQVFAPRGRFLTWFPTRSGGYVRMRQIDNIHLCPLGAAAMAEVVVDDIGPALGLAQPAPGWQTGPWTRDPRYNVGVAGPGACPSDQPLSRYAGLNVPTGSAHAPLLNHGP